MFTLPGKIPVRISGGFWIVAALIGYIQSFSLWGTLMWMVIVVGSVLFHEMGHAYMAKAFNQRPIIALVPFGGVTSFQGDNKLNFKKQFLIVLNGPIFGFLLFVGAFLLRKTGVITNPFLQSFFFSVQVANLFWTIINLLPVLPMDGGQLLRIGLEASFGIKGFRAALFISMILAGIASFAAFAFVNFLVGAILFMFAFQSFEMWYKTKNITKKDRDGHLAQLLEKGEKLLSEKKMQEAEDTFGELRDKTKKGLLFVAATQYLALIEREKGELHLAYELFLSIKDDITPEAIFNLHEMAFIEENYSLVTELSAKTYQYHPSQRVALRNAESYGFLEDAKAAGGWLQTAFEYGGLQKEDVLSGQAFSKVIHHPEFLEFFPE